MHRGQVVAFLGPDGAGKSTILELVKAQLAASGTNFQSFYFAPGFLPRYRTKGSDTVTSKPHEGRQYMSAFVFAKITLMLFEFRIGIWKVRRRNGYFLFDRFIHDILVDPRRYRMDRMRWWMRLMLTAAPKPDLLIVITAPAEVIQSRKQEVPFSETARQVERYKDLAARFPSALLIENIGSPEVAAQAVLHRLESG